MVGHRGMGFDLCLWKERWRWVGKRTWWALWGSRVVLLGRVGAQNVGPHGSQERNTRWRDLA